MPSELHDSYHSINDRIIERLPTKNAIIVNVCTGQKNGQDILSSPVLPNRVISSQGIALILSRDLYPAPEFGADPYIHYEFPRVALVATPRWDVGVGAYLTLLEAHGVSEQPALEKLSGVPDRDSVIENLRSWSHVDRLEYVEQRLDEYDRDDQRFLTTIEDGSERRVTELTDDQLELAEQCVSRSAKDPGACYESAITALRGDLSNSRLSYVEGVALPKYGGTLQAHGWIEVDGCVVEPTWPWHRPVPPENCVYYGIEFDPREASDIMASRSRFGTILSEPADLPM